MATTDDGATLAGPLKGAELHDHCSSCVNQWCAERPVPGVSCPMVSCHLACGAAFHSCKAPEHRLLCPLEKVPCLNQASGCPVTLARRRMSAHLEVCPAGVVCCTMNWKKWAVGVPDGALREAVGAERLDFPLPLRDLRALLESLKAAVAERGEPATERGPPLAERRVGGMAAGPASLTASSSSSSSSKLYDATVKMARSLAAALGVINGGGPADDVMEWKGHGDAAPQEDRAGGDGRGELANGLEAAGVLDAEGSEEHDIRHGWLRVKTVHHISGSSVTEAENGQLSGRRGDAVEGGCPTERQEGMTVTAQETSCQQSLSPLLAPACVNQGSAPRAGHVVLENKGLVLLEDQGLMCKFQKDHPLRDPGRFGLSNGMKVPIPDGSFSQPHPEMEDKAADSQGEGDVDLAAAALPLSSEESGRQGSVSDALHPDRAAAAQLPRPAVPRPPRPGPSAEPGRQLRVPVVCGQSFRRDQFCSHFTNVHADIHAGVDGWMEHRCPLAYYGCPFYQLRLRPSTEGARVVQDRHLKAYGLQMCPGVGPDSAPPSDQLSGLPTEILWHIAGFLDSFSLCQLALVSRAMREVCATLLQARGIVELQWERRRPPGAGGAMSWQVKGKAWRFSCAFSPVSSWRFADTPSMSNHLRRCRYNIVERKTKPVPMPAMCPVGDGRCLHRCLRHISQEMTGRLPDP